MAMYYDFPVYRDTYKLILKIFEVTKDFPREYKYTLGQDMKRDALQLVRSIYRANKSTHKKEHTAFCLLHHCRQCRQRYHQCFHGGMKVNKKGGQYETQNDVWTKQRYA